MNKKILLLGAVGSILLVACEKSPDKAISEELRGDYQIEKEMNALADIKDEDYEKIENAKMNKIKEKALFKNIVNEEIKLNENITISKEIFAYGYESEWVEATNEILIREFIKKDFSNKKVQKMSDFLKANLYKNEDVEKGFLENKALEALYAESELKVKDAEIEEYYEKYFLESVYRGLIDLPTYEENPDVYRAMYLEEKANEMEFKIDEKKLEDVVFEKKFKWLELTLKGDNDVEIEVGDKKMKDVVFTYGKMKITVEDIIDEIYGKTFLDVYEESARVAAMIDLVEKVGFDVEKTGEDLKMIGNDYNLNQIAEFLSVVYVLEEMKYFEGENFQNYYLEKTSKMQFTDEMKMNETLNKYIKFKFFEEKTTDMEQVEKVLNEIKKFSKKDMEDENIKGLEEMISKK